MDHANEFPVKKMCEVFTVSRSGYYKWLKNKDHYILESKSLNDEIKTVFESRYKT